MFCPSDLVHSGLSLIYKSKSDRPSVFTMIIGQLYKIYLYFVSTFLSSIIYNQPYIAECYSAKEKSSVKKRHKP